MWVDQLKYSPKHLAVDNNGHGIIPLLLYSTVNKSHYIIVYYITVQYSTVQHSTYVYMRMMWTMCVPWGHLALWRLLCARYCVETLGPGFTLHIAAVTDSGHNVGNQIRPYCCPMAASTLTLPGGVSSSASSTRMLPPVPATLSPRL